MEVKFPQLELTHHSLLTFLSVKQVSQACIQDTYRMEVKFSEYYHPPCSHNTRGRSTMASAVFSLTMTLPPHSQEQMVITAEIHPRPAISPVRETKPHSSVLLSQKKKRSAWRSVATMTETRSDWSLSPQPQ